MKRSVLVVGLGRFGTAAALELMRLGHEVLAVDLDEVRVNDVSTDVTHAAQLDASDDDALRSVGAGDFEHAIVAISGNAEASIFATMALKTLGVRDERSWSPEERTRRYMEVIAPAKVREGQKNLAKKRRYANRHG